MAREATCPRCGVSWRSHQITNLEQHPCLESCERTIQVLYEHVHAVCDSHDCLIPTRNVRPFGYAGKYSVLTKYGQRAFGTLMVHRAAFLLANGSVPDGLVISHECDDAYENGHCINVEHMFARTMSENHRRMSPELRTRISRAGAASPGAIATRFQPGHTPWNKSPG